MLQALLHFFHVHLWPSLIVALSTLAVIIKLGFPVIKEWFGFKKKVIETEKVKLEVKDLQEKRSNRLVPATGSDVTRYDPKIKSLLQKLQERGPILVWFLVLGLGGAGLLYVLGVKK